MLHSNKRLLSVAISNAILLSAISISPVAYSQAGTDIEEEVLVQGTALTRKKSIAVKKDALAISDAWSTDELGQLPDKNVGESLNRLPGVSMLVEKGEGRFVQIRGIQPALNNVTLNGVSLGSPEADGGGRLAPMDIISGSMLSGVQVVKTPTPDMDAQGIGGTVNIDVKKPFDQEDEFYGHATARYGFEEYDAENEAYGGHDPYALDGLISGKNADMTFGWLLGGSFSAREYVAQGIYQDDWAQVDDSDLYLPVEVKNNYYIIGRERTNLSGVIQFKPNENAEYFARAFWAKWDEFQHRNRYQQSLTQDVIGTSADMGTSGADRVSANVRLENAEKSIFSFSVGGENKSEALTLDYELQLNNNTLDEPYSYWEFRSGRDFGPNTWSVSGDGIVSISADAGTPDRQDPALIDFRRVRFQERDMTEDAVIAQGNLKWDLNSSTYLKSGVKVTSTSRDNNYDLSRFDGGDMDLNLATSADFSAGAFTNDVEAGDVPNIWMDVDAMDRFFNNSANAGYFEENEGDSFATSYASDYELTEDIYAAYVMGVKNFAKTELIGGLRVESTNIDSEGYVLLPGDVTEKIHASGDYVNLLPSVIVKHQLTETSLLRGGITRGLGRPNYDAIAPRSSYSEETGVGSLNIGNPNLEARISWNFDISFEWYPNDLTLISVAAFYKDIEDEIVSSTEQYNGQAEIDAAIADLGLSGTIDTGILDSLEVTTQQNGESSELQGIEFNAQTQFASLPAPFDGLGASFSTTFIDAEVEIERNGETETLPLPGQTETAYNLSLFYQRDALDLALSYAYNDSFLTDIGGDRATDLDQGEFGRWDFKASWEARKNLKVFLEALNLNNEPTTEFQGGVERRNTEFEYIGRSIYLGVSYGF